MSTYNLHTKKHKGLKKPIQFTHKVERVEKAQNLVYVVYRCRLISDTKVIQYSKIFAMDQKMIVFIKAKENV